MVLVFHFRLKEVEDIHGFMDIWRVYIYGDLQNLLTLHYPLNVYYTSERMYYK